MRVDCVRIGSVRLCLALMLGMLVIPGYVVAPLLFAHAGSLAMAGMLAGEIFHMTNLGLMMIAAAVIVFWLRMRSSGMQIGRLRWSLLAAVTALIVINEYSVSPVLADLKAQIGVMDLVAEDHPLRQKFGMWHGISAVIHLVASLTAVALVAVGPIKPGDSCSS